VPNEEKDRLDKHHVKQREKQVQFSSGRSLEGPNDTRSLFLGLCPSIVDG
jgi:hypothetical protein